MERVHVINIVRQMTANDRLNLELIHRAYKGKFHRGRPEMLLMRMTNGRNLQMFRGGKVQIFGNIGEHEAESMRLEFIDKLRRILPKIQISKLTILNMVVGTNLLRTVPLRNIPSSDKHVFYEVELFPAALIRKWHPAHIAVFHNGKVIITGVKTIPVLSDIVSHLEVYIAHHFPLCTK